MKKIKLYLQNVRSMKETTNVQEDFSIRPNVNSTLDRLMHL
jgi:hypothetical protein